MQLIPKSPFRFVLRFLTLACCAVALGLAPQADQATSGTNANSATASGVPAYRAANRVVIIPIEGPIDAVTYKSVKRRMAYAESAGAEAIVFELNTPGGEVGAVLDICKLI